MFLFLLVLGWWGNRIWPTSIPLLPAAIRVGLAMVLLATGAVFAATSMQKFVRAKTTVNPYGEASRLVTRGLYSISRNPFYVALVALLAGAGLLSANAWTLAAALLLFVALDLLVIRGEERFLRDRFGDEWDQYVRRARRWL
jgi:protein-S-isoprenylcysteine O-methyltransferase Ste14